MRGPHRGSATSVLPLWFIDVPASRTAGTGVTPPQGPLPRQHPQSDVPTAPTQPVKPVGDLLPTYWGWIWLPVTAQGSGHGPDLRENLFPIAAESQPFLELRRGSCGGHGHPHSCRHSALCSGRVAEQPLCPGGCCSGCGHCLIGTPGTVPRNALSGMDSWHSRATPIRNTRPWGPQEPRGNTPLALPHFEVSAFPLGNEIPVSLTPGWPPGC